MRDNVRRRKTEEGALLVILMVGVAVAMVGLAVAFQQWSIVWRRDNEEELIFRGQQYVDAIKAYRKEHGNQCPPNLEELMKPGPRQVRYIRKLFKDPMTHNGKWGLLYLMPGGNAIYDPVAAQVGKDQKNDAGPKDDNTTFNPTMSPGVTPISDPMGAMGQPGQMPGQPGMGGGGMGPQGMGGGPSPSAAARLQQMGLQVGGGSRGFGGAGGGFGGQSGYGTMGATGMALPPVPASTSTSEDDKSVSEPSIGWPIVGVISRAKGKVAEDTYKIYKGHEHVNEWQFHCFDQGPDQTQAPTGTLPGGSPPPFIGPGFGGQGPIGGIGGGPGTGRNRPGQGMNNPWFPGNGGNGGRGNGGQNNQGGNPNQ